MITNDDIEFMKLARAEILAGREFEVELLKEPVSELDVDTGERLNILHESVFVKAHVTEISGKQIQVEGGVLTTEGDIKVDINIDDWTPVKFFNYVGRKFRVIGANETGIGQRNRIEVLGELIH
ncbi:hypothetical protein QJV38_07270 [Listeria cossartiae subsp. cayugensis]|uniref:Phage protein n=1 Tax=Listeria cossartiae subsp. cayugensis TaxID=2713505 RepID=A0ABU2IIQ7_9LIST|nr:hypothetical protein [Listeria cossartiae]MDT0064555.1 hypothetical protein [Listeria cossartiae subsp. cayugensis]MDT0079841.1 hypothetical protein [Listeria cossartiae subsp. cayugensis]MDT0082677.1 hypothetical protein [Listeria cossartiae subsp. cayugensis]MDT0086788.1 hypothetical protein [Listeria cossartiae subsp. cayugensis]MDT0099294.1 hypothetical protein [Listeria cossartiae subsp. cayugensis]